LFLLNSNERVVVAYSSRGLFLAVYKATAEDDVSVSVIEIKYYFYQLL